MAKMGGHQVERVLFLVVVLASLVASAVITQAEAGAGNNKKDVNRKSIVFDVKTPKVFYCPQEKQSDYSKTIVKAKPLEKLCEFEGKPKPKNEPSDCYNDVDETEFACDEKRRFLLRLDPPGESPALEQTGVATVENLDDLDYMLSKGSIKKQKSMNDSGRKSF